MTRKFTAQAAALSLLLTGLTATSPATAQEKLGKGEVKAIALLQLVRQLLCLSAVYLALDIFDQRQHVAHAEDTGGNTIRVERLERFSFLAHAEELNRLTCDVTNGERRTAAGVTVHFGQHHAG